MGRKAKHPISRAKLLNEKDWLALVARGLAYFDEEAGKYKLVNPIRSNQHIANR